MDEIEYRELIASDATAVRNLRLAVIETDPESFTISPEAERRGSIEALSTMLGNFHSADDRIVLGAFAPGLVGMIGAECVFDNSRDSVVRLWGMNVQQAHRHQGIATRLIELAIDFARSRRMDKLRLEVTTAALDALSLYRKSGFTEVAVQPPVNSNCPGSLLMELSLR